MQKRREREEVLVDIKQNNLLFNSEKFLEHTERNIEYIYKMVMDKKYEQIANEISNKALEKLINEPEKYRITSNIDNIVVQYAELYDYIISDEEYIKVYMSIYFYDKTSNNKVQASYEEGYWNDIWIATYKKKKSVEEVKLNCNNCGAVMRFTSRKGILQCEYCNSTKYFDYNVNNWILDDVEKLK